MIGALFAFVCVLAGFGMIDLACVEIREFLYQRKKKKSKSLHGHITTIKDRTYILYEIGE